MQKFLTVATVLKPQGIRGEIKVMPQTDSAEDMKDFSSVIIDGTSYKVLACRLRRWDIRCCSCSCG